MSYGARIARVMSRLIVGRLHRGGLRTLRFSAGLPANVRESRPQLEAVSSP